MSTDKITHSEIRRLMASNAKPSPAPSPTPIEGYNLLLMRIWRAIWLAKLAGSPERLEIALDRHAEYFGWKPADQERALEIIGTTSGAEIVAALARTERTLGNITLTDLALQVVA